MDRNELYLQYAEEVDERLNKKDFKTAIVKKII